MTDGPTPDDPIPTTATRATLSPILRASRLGLVILGALYTVGLLIVNIDLARYGLLSVDLARAEYVMAGALWSFLMVATLAGLDYCSRCIKEFIKQKKTWTNMLFLTVNVLGTIGLFHYAIGILSRDIVLFNIFEPRAAWIFLWIILSGLTLSIAIKSVGTLLQSDAITLGALFEGRRPPIYWSVIALSMLGTYAIAVHPQFPREFGGGKRAPVYLVVSDNIPSHLMDLPVPVAGARIGPVLLLFETATMYMVKPAEEREERSKVFGLPIITQPAVGIDKRFIGALIYSAKGETEKKDPAVRNVSTTLRHRGHAFTVEPQT
jgi:hypothetical protein